MKYGDLVYKRDYYWRFLKIGWYTYRFRIDPVPRTGLSVHYRGNFKHWYKRPKTTQERKLFYKYEGYVRGRRSAHMLPNSWDDWLRADGRDKFSWKKSFKCRKQWMKHIKN